MSNFTSANIIETRTAGGHTNAYKSIQSWKTPKNIEPKIAAQHAQKHIINNLDKAADGQIGIFDIKLQTAQAYAGNAHASSAINKNDEFKFNDVIDIVNPLQHLPLINMVYRGITGDEIKPMSQIIGGAIYGGPVGAVTGTANAITKIQTGKDIGDHALELVGLGRKNINSSTEIALNEVTDKLNKNAPLNDLPKNANAFVNAAEPQQAIQAYERVAMANGRTAGSSYVHKNWAQTPVSQEAIPSISTQQLALREEITSVRLNSMPPKRDV